MDRSFILWYIFLFELQIYMITLLLVKIQILFIVSLRHIEFLRKMTIINFKKGFYELP